MRVLVCLHFGVSSFCTRPIGILSLSSLNWWVNQPITNWSTLSTRKKEENTGAIIQVIHPVNDQQGQWTLVTEQFKEDMEKMRRRITPWLRNLLKIYWQEVRPNFIPAEGLASSQFFFLNQDGQAAAWRASFSSLPARGQKVSELGQSRTASMPRWRISLRTRKKSR